jgi:peptide/histidine transporter 3/4
VEEVKCLTRLLPVWSAGIVYYIVLTNLGNYNVLQAMQTDRHIGRSGFEIPAGSFVVFNMLALTCGSSCTTPWWCRCCSG